MVQASPGVILSMKLTLMISGRKLRDLDFVGKSDPKCLIFEQKNGQWAKIGETEQIQESLNPDFATTITVDYFFEKIQKLKLVMIDGDGHGDYDTIGAIETTMGDLMGAANQTFKGKLKHDGQDNRGQIIVRSEAVQETNEQISCTLRWAGIDNQVPTCFCLGSETHPYRCYIQREMPDGTWFSAWQSDEVLQTQTATYNDVTINLGVLCQNDKSRRLKFCIRTQQGAEVNSALLSIADVEQGRTVFNTGTDDHSELRIENFVVQQVPSFLDYLRSGVGISMVGAIDYTASNGAITSPDSLHTLDPARNQYRIALQSVGYVIQPYDADQSFPVFGFGGIPRHMGMNGVSHCFPLNGNPSNPEIFGIEGIVSTYETNLQQIGLGGPTYFVPILEQFLQYVRSVKATGAMSYNILLILTDGAIHDMPRTKDLVCELALEPCSIIIIGVGSADFSSMEALDGDGGKLRNQRGVVCPRDIVQFVEFGQAMQRGDLAEQVLKEVPKQLVSYYMQIAKFLPVAMPHGDISAE